MGKVNSNDLAFAYAREATGQPGVLPVTPIWKAIEPNAAPNWGNEVKTVARNPISKSRQRRKGRVTDLDSGVEIDADFTLSGFRDFAESFVYAQAVGPEVFTPTAVAAGSYTVPALSGTQAGHLIYSGGGAKTLVYARGFALAANNGLKVLGADDAAAATTITVAGTQVEALTAGQQVEVAICGIRAAAGDLQIDAQGNLTSTALDFTLLGLTVGQGIHIGGIDAANQFLNEENYGMVRLAAIAPHKLTLVKHNQPFLADDGTVDGAGGAGVAIDLLFGQFIRNVPVDHADYRVITHQFELASPGLGAAGETLYEYSQGNYANQMVITVPLTEKATVKWSFVGLYTTDPDTARATGAAAQLLPNQTESFGTSSDLARLRVQQADEAGLSTDFKSLTITIKNNSAGDKVLGKLGPKYVNAGNFEVDTESEQIFSNAEVIETIRCSRTVGLDTVLRNGDGGILIDLPSGTLSGGKRNIRENQSVTINTPFAAHRDDTLGHTLGFSLFPVLPVETCE
jgi:hypothetical protein